MTSFCVDMLVNEETPSEKQKIRNPTAKAPALPNGWTRHVRAGTEQYFYVHSARRLRTVLQPSFWERWRELLPGGSLAMIGVGVKKFFCSYFWAHVAVPSPRRGQGVLLQLHDLGELRHAAARTLPARRTAGHMAHLASCCAFVYSDSNQTK